MFTNILTYKELASEATLKTSGIILAISFIVDLFEIKIYECYEEKKSLKFFFVYYLFMIFISYSLGTGIRFLTAWSAGFWPDTAETFLIILVIFLLLGLLIGSMDSSGGGFRGGGGSSSRGKGDDTPVYLAPFI